MNVDKVSIVFICLREYNLFFDRFYDSCEKLFLRGIPKQYYVITDHGPDFLGDKDNVTYCQVRTPKRVDDNGKRRVDKRAIKLNKFTYIDNYWSQIRESDYIFYFDADSVIRRTIRQEDVIDPDKSIVGVVHGFGSVRNGTGRKGNRFEDDPASSAYVDPDKYDTTTYYQSCLWGGKPNDVRAMVDDVKYWIEKDLDIGHKNKYNICDEVYVNKYFALNKSALHELDGRYSCPSEGIAFRKGRDYISSKEVMVSHECAAQNNTYRKFMNSDKQNKPIAFHFNGKSISKYEESSLKRLEKLLDKNIPKNNASENVQLFTFDDKLDNPFLIDCCKKLGLDLINLATPEKIAFLKEAYPVKDFMPSERFTLLFKILSLYHYFKSNASNKKYYCLMDQSDIYLTDRFTEEKLEIFKHKKCNILYNAETRCMYWPMIFRRDERYPDFRKYFINYGDVKVFEQKTYGNDCYESNGHNLCFLNGGAVLAETDYFVDLIDKYLLFIKEFINTNEQTMLHHFHFCYYPDIQIDHKCEIFQCMGPNKIDFKI